MSERDCIADPKELPFVSAWLHPTAGFLPSSLQGEHLISGFGPGLIGPISLSVTRLEGGEGNSAGMYPVRDWNVNGS